MKKEERKRGRPKKTTQAEIDYCLNCNKTCDKGVCDELRAVIRGTSK